MSTLSVPIPGGVQTQPEADAFWQRVKSWLGHADAHAADRSAGMRPMSDPRAKPQPATRDVFPARAMRDGAR